MNRGQQLLHRIRKNRGCIRLLSLDALICLLRTPCGDPLLRAAIASESIIRAWLLAGGACWRDRAERPGLHSGWIEYGLPPASIELLESWLDGQARVRSFDLPDVSGFDERLSACLAGDMANWRHANGVIPLVCTCDDDDIASCTILPFFIRCGGTSQRSRVVTADEGTVMGMSEGLDRAAHALCLLGLMVPGRSIQVFLPTLQYPDIPLKGRSIGLSIVVACYLKEHLPSLHALAVGASGCLNFHGCLDPEHVHAQSLNCKGAYLRDVGVPVRILPGINGVDADHEGWPVGCSLTDNLQRLAQEMEFPPEAFLPPENGDSILDVESSLNALDEGMAHGIILAGTAENQLRQFESLLSKRKGLRNRQLYQMTLGLLATALCHQGRTRESDRIAGQLLAIGNDIGIPQTVKTIIRMAVNRTDFADYEGAVKTCDDAMERLPHIRTGVEQHEARLHAVSTKAQALMYWAMIDPARTREARDLAVISVDLARELDGELVENGRQDTPRNLVYLYLWHALHDSENAEAFYREHRDTMHLDHASRQFSFRVRWYAWFRAWQCRRDLPSIDPVAPLPDPGFAGGWLHVLALKYRGVYRASRFQWDEARNDFQRSLEYADQYARRPFLAFLVGTSALQAAESLSMHAPDESRVFAIKAMALMGAVKDWFAHDNLAIERWLDRARATRDGEDTAGMPTPQIYLPY